MALTTLELAERVVQACSRERPADRVLRETLRAEKGLTRASASAVSRLVLRYFRWSGLLEPGLPIGRGITRANELAGEFDRRPESFPLPYLLRAVPPWVVEQLPEVSEAWLRSIQSDPVLWLRARSGDSDEVVRELEQAEDPKGWEAVSRGEAWVARPGRLPGSVEYRGSKDLFRTEAFQRGAFEIQDISSQAVGLMSAPQPGECWWDACAGEGGKTLHWSALMQNRGMVWATDRAEWRLKTLRLRARRAQCFNYRAEWWDGTGDCPARRTFDGVLVDGPCSGVGTWHRNGQARWTLRESDVTELAAEQRGLLAAVAPWVKRGGKLIYSVCTLTRAETDRVADAFQAAHPGFEPAELPAGPWGGGPGGRCWIWPATLRGNGMFVAAWRRTDSPRRDGGGG